MTSKMRIAHSCLDLPQEENGPIGKTSSCTFSVPILLVSPFRPGFARGRNGLIADFVQLVGQIHRASQKLVTPCLYGSYEISRPLDRNVRGRKTTKNTFLRCPASTLHVPRKPREMIIFLFYLGTPDRTNPARGTIGISSSISTNRFERIVTSIHNNTRAIGTINQPAQS